jgi:hypothetical protein
MLVCSGAPEPAVYKLFQPQCKVAIRKLMVARCSALGWF